jgi:hypothetical protein
LPFFSFPPLFSFERVSYSGGLSDSSFGFLVQFYNYSTISSARSISLVISKVLPPPSSGDGEHPGPFSFLHNVASISCNYFGSFIVSARSQVEYRIFSFELSPHFSS